MTCDIIRVFPRRTSLTPDDALAFIGPPGLWRPEAAEVHISVTFTWDKAAGLELQKAWAQYYPVVKIGGPAIGGADGPLVPGRYIKQGVTFTTRGCNNHCGWCLVPDLEGRLTEIENFNPGNIIQDNNLFQASAGHIDRVLKMLNSQRRAAKFSGGVQTSLVGSAMVEKLKTVRIDEIYLAADTRQSLKPLRKALTHLTELPHRKKRCYTMIGYDGETLTEARERLTQVFKMGALPFAQLYQPPDRFIDYPPDWKKLAYEFMRPAAMFSMFGELDK